MEQPAELLLQELLAAKAELESRNEALLLVNDLIHRLQRRLDVEAIAAETVKVLARHSQSPCIAFYLLDGSKGPLRLVAAHGFTERERSMGAVLTLEGSASGQAVKEQRIVQVGKVLREGRAVHPVLTALADRSLSTGLCIPLSHGGTPLGTLNVLEYCRRHRATLVLLSSSRVYAIEELAGLPVEAGDSRFRLREGATAPGLSVHGLTEAFSTRPPLSPYGASKLASEILALEYGETFGFPVRVKRCGLLAGAGQFGRPDQGIVAFWIHAWANGHPLTYTGLGGLGLQVRDVLHPRDLVPLVEKQASSADGPRVVNVSGGTERSISLRELSLWCSERFGPREVAADPADRRFDVPWLVLDSSLARTAWGFTPAVPLPAILEEIARHAEADPSWLERSGVS